MNSHFNPDRHTVSLTEHYALKPLNIKCNRCQTKTLKIFTNGNKGLHSHRSKPLLGFRRHNSYSKKMMKNKPADVLKHFVHGAQPLKPQNQYRKGSRSTCGNSSDVIINLKRVFANTYLVIYTDVSEHEFYTIKVEVS